MLPAEISAASVLISFWNETINGAVWVTVGVVVVVGINLMGAGERFHLIQNHISVSSSHSHHSGVYGEAEFIFAQVLILQLV